MGTATQVVDYQRRCYEADNREASITSLLHAKIRHTRFLDGDEVVISGTLPRIALPQKYAEELRKETYKYRRDKSLVYAALPIVGCGKAYGGLPDRLCAPLVFLNADFELIHESLFLVPNVDEIRINYPALAQIAEATGVDSDRVERALNQLPAMPWPRERLHALAAALAEVLPAVDFTPLSEFPKLVPAKTIHGYFAADIEAEQLQRGLTCLPAAAVALLPNSPETRGVLFELSQLSTLKHLSRPLQCLLDEQRDQSGRQSGRQRRPVSPSVLSDAQHRALVASAAHPLTQIIGPPGTGKSFTIASIALDHLSRNQTVLIASRMDQAVDVVAAKMESLIGPTNAIVRAGRKSHLRELKTKLEDLLSGVTDAASKTHTASNSREQRRQLHRLDHLLASRENQIQELIKHEIAWGALETQASAGFFGRWTDVVAKKYRNWCLGDADLWQEFQNYQTQLDQRSALVKEYLQTLLSERVARMLRRRREDLTKFLTALRARSDSKQQSLFGEIDFADLLHAFPVWLCKLTDLSNVLPFQRGLFDVVILDEATQCDIASCLPLLQRGKRAVVVGDPKQLRHISFLPETRQRALAQECELTVRQQELFHFRDKSILDVVSDSIIDQGRVSFLNEHFRSLPDIIRFSNDQFYSNALSIMREQPYTAQLRCVHARPCNGTRESNGTNPMEADGLVADLVARITANEGTPQDTQSIGVLSPFRDQVDYLAKALDRVLSYEQMRQHQLLVGTAHTFQGEERDVMYISLAIDDAAHAATVRFLNTPQLLNVAVTRARHLQLLYTSFNYEQLDKQSLLYELMHCVAHPVGGKHTSSNLIDAFRREVVCELQHDGLTTWEDFRIASEPMDVIVESWGRTLALDLIGYPGQMSQAYSLERYRMIHRAGLHVLPLSYRDWQIHKPRVLHRIKDFCQTQSQ
ncbi:MAG: AAA domain-containing protein [Pirellulaceae bacterium]